MAHAALLIVSPAHSAGWVAEVITLHQHKGKMKNYTTRKTFERLVSACGLRGINVERFKDHGKPIILTAPNGKSSPFFTVSEAWFGFENEDKFKSLPVLPIKLPRAAYLDRPELSFDGCGINGSDEYRTRIATFSNQAEKYGPLFAAAPDLLAALEQMTESFVSHFQHGREINDARAAIRKAKEVA